MIWYVVFTVLSVLFGIATFAGFILFIITGCDCPEIAIISFASMVILIGCTGGATFIEHENTEIDIVVEDMEITKCEITSASNTQYSYLITVADKYVIKINEEEYAKLNKGDIVTVEITTETVFGEKQNSIASLKE